MPSCRLTNKPSTHVHPVLPCYLPRRKVYVGPCPLIVIPSVLCTVCTRWPIWVPLRTLVRLSTCSGRLWPPKIHTDTQTERPNRNAEFKVLPRNEGLERIEYHRRIRAAPSPPWPLGIGRRRRLGGTRPLLERHGCELLYCIQASEARPCIQVFVQGRHQRTDDNPTPRQFPCRRILWPWEVFRSTPTFLV